MEEAGGDNIKECETALAKELQDLKNEIEENDLVHGLRPKAISSVPTPKDAEYFRKERRLAVQRLLQVSDAKPLPILADAMRDEMQTCVIHEHSERSVLLLLLDHFTSRMHELANCRYEHLLRWRRFREHLGVLENLQPYFASRMENLLQQYEDYSARAQRLSSVREAHLYGNDTAVDDVQPEDLVLYIRWLVSHLQSLRLYTQLLRVIQWTPYAHRYDVTKELPQHLSNKEATTFEENAAGSRVLSASARAAQALSDEQKQQQQQQLLEEPPTPPPMIAPSVTAHNPVSQTQFTLALAAAATGTVWNASQLALPLHCTETEELKPHLLAYCEVYSVPADVESLGSPSDEMEMFAAVNRKFRQIFFQQEVQRTFKTYDRGELQLEDGVSLDKKIAKYRPKADAEKWGLDTPHHAMRKEANWLKYIQLKPEKNLINEQKLSELRRRRNVDELLKFSSRFVCVSDPERVQDTLRSHAAAVANPPHLQGAAVATYASGKKIIEAWRKIYSNPQIYDESVSYQSSAEQKKKKRRNSFDFNQTMQMLGLNDADTMKDDPSGTQGAYLSYLHLRQLKIRDLRRSCLSLLNYFRSLERTLTINDQGIFVEGGSREQSPVEHRSCTESEGHQGGTSVLGAHAYMYSTPKDHKYSECDFMRYQEVDNFDDFYSHEEGRVHVRDQRGFYIVYDRSMKDLSELEEDLILVASHFIQKDRDEKEAFASGRAARAANNREGAGSSDDGDFSIGKYGHAAVDRFAVLLDMWNQEAQFMQSKKALIDLYMEAYHNTFDRDEKRQIASVVYSLIHRRPRYDFEASYFLTAYRLECAAMRLQASLLQKFMDRQIAQQREFVSRINRDSGSQGLPLDFVAKQLVSVHTDQAAAKSLYMLEFHPSLSVVSRLPHAYQLALTEMKHLHQAQTPTEEIQLERCMFEILLKEWESLDQIGASYTPQTKNNLFSGIFMDDPSAVAAMAKAKMSESDSTNSRMDKRQKKKRLVEAAARVMELSVQRHRLIDLAWESEVLAKIYKHIAHDTGLGEFHAFIRYIQMESARKVDGAETARPLADIRELLEDDSFIDKFQPSSYLLGIQEIDEGHLGRFSFRSKDGVLALLQGSGTANLQIVLKLQSVHRSGLSAAVLLAHMCRFDPTGEKSAMKSGRLSPTDTKSERSTVTAMTGASAAGGGIRASMLGFDKQHAHCKFDPAAFFSVQLEKTPARTRMINSFVAKKEASAMLMKSQNELEKLKRELIGGFCDDYELRVRQVAMRAQIIGYCNSIRDNLQQMPAVAEMHFTFGVRNELKSEEDDEKNMDEDPRSLKRRPRRFMSETGDKLLNLWFIPHYTELLLMFRSLDDRRSTRGLEHAVRIIGSLHDILQFLIGYSRLGTGGSRSAARTEGDADWSGSQGLGSELREIQKQIDHLPDPRNPEQVAEMLELKRHVLLLEFDLCVRNVLRETFLSSGNMPAYRSVTENMQRPLIELSDTQVACLESVGLQVPSPLEARDQSARELFPWRSLMGRRGPYTSMPWQWHTMQHHMQLCLAGLREVDKPIVHGELLSLNLCLEDVARTGEIPEAFAGKKVQVEEKENFLLIGKRMMERMRKRPEDEQQQQLQSSANSSTGFLIRSQPLSTLEQSREAYRLMVRFLILWKRVNALKYYWGRLRMNVNEIDSYSRYQQFCKLYKSEKLYPIMRSLAIQFGQEELYEPGPPQADTDVFVTPKGVPEMTMRQRQLMKLLEFAEIHMISEVRKRLQREADLVIKERNRDEDNLPTDLWKRTCMKESFSIKRPPFLNQFLDSLDKAAVETDDGRLTFDPEDLNKCLNQLCSLTAQSQREMYENYASFYESILKQQHQVMYDRDREIQHLSAQLQEKEESIAIEAQLLMADNAHSLIMEVTALRSLAEELRERTIKQRQEIRDSIIDEYREQVQGLAAVCFEQKMRLDEYRKHMLAASLAKIKEVRLEASDAMTRIQERTATSRLVTERELIERNEKITAKLANLETENARLLQLMNRQKALANWKQTNSRCEQQKKMSELNKEKEHQRRRAVALEIMSTERTQQLQQEMQEVKDFLVRTERELGATRKKLERLQREDQDRRHADERRERSDRQLADAKQLHIDKLMDEITETKRTFTNVKDDLSRNIRSQQSIADKSTREVEALRQQLREEKKLKEDAFGRVDSLLSQVYELESVQAMSRAQTSIGFAQTPAGEGRLRSGNVRPSTTSGRKSAALRPASSNYAPMPPRLSQKSLTPDPLRLPRANGQQRPMTVSVSAQRLRSRVADQLLHNIQPDHHETLMQLRDASAASMN